MTRQGLKKWKDTEVFKHWINGGEIEVYSKRHNDWYQDNQFLWEADNQYRIKKPLNKWAEIPKE